MAKGEKRKSKQPIPVEDEPPTETGTTTTITAGGDDTPDAEEPVRPTIETDIDNTETSQVKSPESGSATSPASPTKKVRGWIRNRFSRGKSVNEQDAKDGKRKSFLGGVALRGSGSGADGSTASLDNRADSMRDVAMAGKTGDDETDLYKDSRGVSPVSSDSDEVEEAGPSTMLAPKPLEDPVARKSSSSFTRDSRFKELMDR